MEKTLTQQPSSCLKIVLFGPESTGKTTLAKQLAKIYHTHWIPEYMREYLEKKWHDKGELISREDLVPIAQGQMAAENEAAQKTKEFLFCDTNLLELKVYCDYYYNKYCPEEILEAIKHHSYDHYFLTDIDVPWEPDILRDRPYDRSMLFRMFEATLKVNNLPFTKLTGNPKKRLRTARTVLENLKRTHYAK
ncbi:MAG: ATP-binding protein [Flavobacteriaceae bacterium]